MYQYKGMEDTIAAIATAAGIGSIGVIRLSGKSALAIADKVIFLKSEKKISQADTYTVHYGWVKKDKEIIAVLIFGSYARGENYRDIDICLVLSKKYDNLTMSKKRLLYSSLAPEKIDIQVFQQLPIYIRKRILKEGKIVLCKNMDLFYDIAFAALREFEFYKKIYYNYLSEIEKSE